MGGGGATVGERAALCVVGSDAAQREIRRWLGGLRTSRSGRRMLRVGLVLFRERVRPRDSAIGSRESGGLASVALVLAAVHAPKRQPGEPKQGKCDRNADLVHEEDLTGMTVPCSGITRARIDSGGAGVSCADLCIRRTHIRFRDLCHQTMNFASFSCFFSVLGPFRPPGEVRVARYGLRELDTDERRPARAGTPVPRGGPTG